MSITYRVIVVGAGIYGLAAAKTYLQLFPGTTLTVLDADSHIGGVWSPSRTYPFLVVDSPPATFEFSDFPMDDALGVKRWQGVRGEVVGRYLEMYVDKWGFKDKVRLNTKVLDIRKDKGSKRWKIYVENEGKKYNLQCEKLIIATGTSSIPSFPIDIEWSGFEGMTMHSKDVGEKHQLLTSDKVKRVTVLGGNKSAVDIVNICALAGKDVDWVIRKDGLGPGHLHHAVSCGIHLARIATTRAFPILFPNFLKAEGFWYWFLHSGKSRFGSWLWDWMMAKMGESEFEMYKSNENMMKIAPDIKDIVFSNSGDSVVYDDGFLDMVRDGKLIHVHRDSILSLYGRSVQLANGGTLPCDAAVFATGWQISQSKFFEPNLLAELGLPFDLNDEDPMARKYWEALNQEWGFKFREQFPVVANIPADIAEYDRAHQKPAATTPFRLFRGMASPALTEKGDRSLLVLGTLININVPIYAEVSSLWGVAYLENLPFSKPLEETLRDRQAMNQEISCLESWGEFKTRGSTKYLDLAEQTRDLIDILITDLGLRADRMRWYAENGGWKGIFGLRVWIKEWFRACEGSDYRGLVEEYKTRWEL